MKNIEDKSIIKFYRATGKYGFLSNLYKFPLYFEGNVFPTGEHAYQYGKFKDEDTREWAMKSPKPHLLSILAHGLFSWDIVKNWNKIKVDRMYNVLKAKFLYNELRELFPKDMRKYNSYGKREKSKMTIPLNLLISAQMERGIHILIQKGKFKNKSEFIRYLIIKYFDEMTFYG